MNGKRGGIVCDDMQMLSQQKLWLKVFLLFFLVTLILEREWNVCDWIQDRNLLSLGISCAKC
jgi:hypothetical protein